ncbi:MULTISPECIES: glutathione-disulfide reductase [Ramlibacter]|uniref:Glutathione-disulfide reductase n=1 Tax=Ramlibacter aquaticus TaxID=2780094 RepID=A0ABR9SET2_9BURK|nr:MULTISPECIES: glutathione-disulfide reductase [Ramlibacter]MBE7940567.1 glutathione-disulfide reductase [Ramlibacter aquaticus]
MTSGTCDFFVIGGGSGGVRAARMAARLGARVVLAEAAQLGGTCVNVGCVPKKLYSYAAHYADDFADARGFGWQVGEPVFDWATLRRNRAAEILRLNGVYEQLLASAGVQMVTGWARLAAPGCVEVQTEAGPQRFEARHILVATGGCPSVPDFPGREHVVTSDAMFDIDPFPRRLLVVGGGYIACEFASIFNGLGSRVTQLYRGSQLLRGFDDDLRHHIAQEMRRHGVDLHTSAQVASITRVESGLDVALADGRRLQVDAVLYATGRVPNVSGLGLEALGVAQGRDGAIRVDEHYATSVPGIHAIGDVTARLQLTPVALGEAMAVVDRLFGPARRRMDYDFVPTAVFTHPNIGTVGYSEAQAREKFGAVTVYRSEFRALRHTLSGRQERTLMKLVVDTASDRVVGVHMVGPEAGEIVQGFAVALKAGATKAVFDATVGIHPTLAEEFVTMRDPVAP